MTGLGLKFSNFIVQLGGNALIPEPHPGDAGLRDPGHGPADNGVLHRGGYGRCPGPLTSLGVDTLAAHLFLFYFASLSAITPPVAVASYAAAGIAQENPMKVGLYSGEDRHYRLHSSLAFALNNDYIIFNLWISRLC